MQISLVVPIYNASNFAEKNIESIVNEFDERNMDYEIILCDDASRDESAKILADLDAKYQAVRVFFNERNNGIGFSLRRLFKEARGDIIVYLDADLTFGVETIFPLIEAVSGSYEIAVASRYLELKNKVPFIRRIASRLYCRVCQKLFDIDVKDIGSGAVAFKMSVCDRLSLTSEGFGIHAEIFARAQLLKMNIKEVPARIVNRKRGSFSIIKHSIGVWVETYRLYKEVRSLKREIKNV